MPAYMVASLNPLGDRRTSPLRAEQLDPTLTAQSCRRRRKIQAKQFGNQVPGSCAALPARKNEPYALVLQSTG